MAIGCEDTADKKTDRAHGSISFSLLALNQGDRHIQMLPRASGSCHFREVLDPNSEYKCS